MKLRISFATATAMSVLMGAALANGNEAYLDQVGANNSAAITQSQTNGSNVGNLAGHETSTRILQQGNNNNLVVNQTHDSAVNSPPRNQANRVGRPGDAAGLGIDQLGNGNHLRIDQVGANQAVFEVQQRGGTTGTINSNRTTITQSGGYSARVSNVGQTFTGVATDAANVIAITQTAGNSSRVGNTSSGPRSDGSGAHQTGTGNQMTISQTGNSQLVYTATQTNNASAGGTNIATVTQSGASNQIRELRQINNGAANNIATLTFSGAGNGASSATFSAGTPAAGVANVTQSRVFQTGAGNGLTYTVAGDDNLFGFNQFGDGNAITGVVSGDGNQLAILHDGDGNNSAIVQNGTNNAGIFVEGNYNRADVAQDGASNEASIRLVGDNNGTGIFGATVAGDLVRAEGINNLVHGRALQNGTGNTLSHNVLGSNNLFAFAQLGSSNTVTSTVSGGNNNQTVVLQNGSSNVSNTTQTGSSNVVAISQ